MTLNPTTRFSGKAEAYTRYRETYDADIILPRLRTWCGLAPSWRIADIGAGTGMLADVFLANGNSVLALEPNPDMRAACAQLHPDTPQLELLATTAEATGLPSASVDAIAIGRALHWFDYDRATAEFRRILRPGGWVFILTVGRDDSARDENIAFTELLARYANSNDPIRAVYALYKRLPETFSDGEYHHAVVPGETRFDWPSFLGYAQSISYTPLPETEAYGAFEHDLRAIFDRFATNGTIHSATRHWINAGRW